MVALIPPQTVLTPAQYKTGTVVYPYEKAKN